jgi:uncharacterized pyridoxal phosphate-containing UPF0001 family protein
MSLDQRYHDVVRRIAGRARLVAVTKGASVADVRALHSLGQRDLGENRAEQLAERRAALPDAAWHFIGNLQRNKLKLLVGAALVHSFDRPDLAPRWPAGVPVLVQVHLGGGEHRNGVPPADAPAVLEALAKWNVRCVGLSVLPPPGEDPRPHFAALRALRDELSASWPEVRELSMGMSADFETAIEEGATMVRVGRALFEREG